MCKYVCAAFYIYPNQSLSTKRALEFAKYTVRLDRNDWNADFVPAMELPEENTRLDAGGGYGGRVRLPWRHFLSSESVRC
eukprot:COSAG02_NODE_786_length_17199_cov_25.278889_12_plen_80_part_00